MKSNQEKMFYTRWWFWVLCLMALSVVANKINPNRENDPKTAQSTPKASEGVELITTADEFSRKIIKIQKELISINKNSREGETSYAEWEAKKDSLLKQLNNSQMSGKCFYKGVKKNIEMSFECYSGDVNEQIKNSQLYAICQSKQTSYGNVVEAECGESPLGELFVLKPNANTMKNINILYDNDRIKFSGVIDKCEIHFAKKYGKQEGYANFKCELNNVNAEIMN